MNILENVKIEKARERKGEEDLVGEKEGVNSIYL